MGKTFDESSVGMKVDAAGTMHLEYPAESAGDGGSVGGVADPTGTGSVEQVGSFAGGKEGKDGFARAKIGVELGRDTPVVCKAGDTVEVDQEQVGTGEDTEGLARRQGAMLMEVRGKVIAVGQAFESGIGAADKLEAYSTVKLREIGQDGLQGCQETGGRHPVQPQVFAEFGAEEDPAERTEQVAMERRQAEKRGFGQAAELADVGDGESGGRGRWRFGEDGSDQGVVVGMGNTGHAGGGVGISRGEQGAMGPGNEDNGRGGIQAAGFPLAG